jgi:D-amino acid aminotransferase
MKIIWKNKIIDEQDIKVDMHDRGYQFGDGLYEVIFIYNGVLFTLEEHIDRFFVGAEKTEIAMPFSKSELAELCKELVAVNNVKTGSVYLQISRGDGIARNHFFPDVVDSTPVLSGFVREQARPIAKIENGIRAITVPDERWLKCDIKTISLMGNVLAKNEGKKAGVEEVIQHRDGIVTECGSSNLFIVKDGILYSHPDGNLILPGITKIVIFRVAAENGVPFKEEAFTLEELFAADEVFLSSTTQELIPIVEIDGKQVGSGKRGTVTKQLHEYFVAAVEKTCGKI